MELSINCCILIQNDGVLNHSVYHSILVGNLYHDEISNVQITDYSKDNNITDRSVQPLSNTNHTVNTTVRRQNIL